MTEHDIGREFKRIETELIESIIANLDKHRAKETKDGLDWTKWQSVQLRELEKYRTRNTTKYRRDFKTINESVEDLFQTMAERGGNGNVDELVKTTVSDLSKAEQAMVRRASDEYRKIILDAPLQGETYEEAINKATKSLLRRGIAPVVYKNGARHSVEDYATMAIRTGSKRAYLTGLGEKMKRLGVHTIIINKRNGACPLCAKWVGRVLVDDVYGGGTKAEARRKELPTLSEAMEQGLYHPNCKDTHSMYVEGVSQPPKRPTAKDVREMVKNYNREQEERRAKAKARARKRIASNQIE